MSDSESSTLTLGKIRSLFDSGTPFTAAEVAEEVDRSHTAVRAKLDELADSDHLETKQTRGNDRVWWHPPEDAHARRTSDRPALTHEQFEELVDTVTEYAIFVLDADGYIQSWNEGAERVKGYEEAEILGEHVSTFYTAGAITDGVPERNLERAAADGQVEDEGWRVRKDGAQFWANVVITVLRHDDGTRRGFIKVTRDMTERHEYEEQLEAQNEHLQRQNTRLESFASMLAHELRNPLTIAQIYLQQAQPRDEDAAEEVKIAHDRIEKMIDVLLITARGADAIIDYEPVEVVATAKDAWADVVVDGAELIAETDRTVETDPVHFQHLFRNLFQNAVEHSDADVTVRVGGLPTGFYVADDGPGIPRAERERVLDAGYTTEADGIGLGLTFVVQLADTYGWEVTITESAEGGARFEFTDVDCDGEEAR